MILRLDRLHDRPPEAEGPLARRRRRRAGAARREVRRDVHADELHVSSRSTSAAARQYRPFYDLIANIAAEEFGHIELVAYAINLLLTGTTPRGTDPSKTPLEPA